MKSQAVLDHETAPTEGALVEVKNLSVTYKTRTGYTKAVDDVSFTINKGEVLGLAGESACGKTTTALSLIRLLDSNAQTEGQVLINGKNILTMSQEQLRDLRWKQVSLIPQGSMNSLDPVIPIGNQIIEAISAYASSEKASVGNDNPTVIIGSHSPLKGKKLPA